MFLFDSSSPDGAFDKALLELFPPAPGASLLFALAGVEVTIKSGF
jgi:hypothetical protein